MNRSEIIELFIVGAASEDRPELRRKLDRMSLDELEQAHQALIANQQLEAKKEQLLQIQAEAAANRALHQHYMKQSYGEAHKAQLKATESQDRETFSKACREYNISNVEANFRMLRETLGPNFNSYEVGQAVTSGAVRVAPATEREREQWRQEAIEEHNLRLRSADIPTLRKLAREAGARGPAEPPQPDETQRVRAAERVEDIPYPPLPEEFRVGDREAVLDATFIKRCPKETLRFLIKRYGSNQITEALRTRVPGNSW